MTKQLSSKAIVKRAGITRQAASKRVREGRASEDYQRSKERKEKAVADLREEQAIIAKLQREVEQGKLVSRESVKKSGLAVGMVFSMELGRIRGNAPAMLAGLDELGIRRELDKILDELLDRLLDGLKGV